MKRVMKKWYQVTALLLAAVMLVSCAPKNGTGERGAEQTGTEQTGSEQTGTDQTESDQTGTDQTESDQTGSEQTGSEQTGTDQTETDQMPEITWREEVSDEYKWDLTEYYADDAAFEAELQQVMEVDLPKMREMAEVINTPDELLELELLSDELNVRMGHLSSYPAQKMSLDASDSVALAQSGAVDYMMYDFSMIASALSNQLIEKDKAFWDAVFADERLEFYWQSYRDILEDADHILKEEEEALLQPQGMAINNVYNTYMVLANSEMEWNTVTDPQGNEILADNNNAMYALLNPDREYRKAFYEAYAGAYEKYKNTFAQLLNTYITLGEQSTVQHNYDSQLAAVTEADGLTPEIYDALIQGARANTDVVAREIEIRKAALGYDEIYGYDMSMPLGKTEAPSFTYEEAQELLKKALQPLGQEYVDTLDEAFKNRWIDVYAGENKDPGAYSGMAIDIHPWVLMNYMNDYYSVSTMAHELGHAVNQYRSNETQENPYNRGVTSLVSEVASTCNELLLSRYMIENAASDEEKLYYIQQELEVLNGTFFTQVSFADFEQQFHKLVEEGQTLTADILDEMFAENGEIYSPGVAKASDAGGRWAGIPHFYYNYYVYNYAIAISVSSVVADAIANGDQEMTRKYLDFLAAGSSAEPPELFMGLGVDVTKPDYIEPLIARYSELLDMEEELLK